ncbi:DUF3667 domain-containing protein [Hymenobacter canadensis]|uniref:DUF3667 domain-containing protein n=1 Tax=Hymenobacter canadensis TaxID=2999067 RepID=A0ABY7LLR9_9BACT|nr:DUF3667 domain-containing protein [Hymenobacter canadensis]WBA41402.1 DUF3667 domain-containing protein [Hymenobacter canadensis]
MAHHATHLPACANCGYSFPPDAPAEFCPRCGQQNHEVNISFGHLVEETLEGLFHFDGKVFRTAGLLLFRPGVLTRQFLEGRRMPYVPPVRLYVFLSFVFFLLLSSATKPEHGQERPMQLFARRAANLTESANDSARQQEQQLLQAIAQAPTPARRDSLRRLLADSVRQRLRAGRQPVLAYLPGTARPDSAAPGNADTGFNVSVMGVKIKEEEVAKLPEDITQAQVDSVLRSKGATPGFWNRLGVKRTVRWHHVTSAEAMHQILRGLSLLIFLIMPLAALLLKGVYFRQHRHYISHLIFTVHVHCFLFVYFGVALLLSKLSFMAWAEDYVLLIPAVYFVVALRNFYQQSWLKTVLKSLLLGGSYGFTLSLALMLVALGGLILF